MQQASTNLAASVVVRVYTEERWPQIEHALSSIAEQTVRPGQVVVVVDHNSAVCQRLATQYPDLEVIPEVTTVTRRPLTLRYSARRVTSVTQVSIVASEL